jgi:hypothetical protein
VKEDLSWGSLGRGRHENVIRSSDTHVEVPACFFQTFMDSSFSLSLGHLVNPGLLI